MISENMKLLNHYIYTVNNFSYWQYISNPCVSFNERVIVPINPFRIANRLFNLKVLDYLNNNQIETA